MSSRAERLRVGVLLALALAAHVTNAAHAAYVANVTHAAQEGPAAQAVQVPPVRAPAPTREQIDAALTRVKADPNLATQRKTRVLRWVKTPQERPADSSGWLRWLVEVFRWIARSARVLVWVVVALLTGLLLVFVLRLIRSRSSSSGPADFSAPSHVQDLDIRPDSLPDDIGATARSLWDAQRQRAALALLYRGLLSRLAHVHALPIRDSSTEGECLGLARTRLRAERAAFVAQLIGVWQASVYGGIEPANDSVHALCDGFGAALDRA